jgi:trans-aconitate 2-methyltransferase
MSSTRSGIESSSWSLEVAVSVVESLILDLLEWIGPESRPYPEVMAAWRTNCPRLQIWEDASERGFIGRHHEDGRGILISVTPLGREHLAKCRPGR